LVSSLETRAALLPAARAKRRGIREAAAPLAGAKRFIVAACSLGACLACGAPRALSAVVPASPAGPARSVRTDESSAIIGDPASIAWARATGSPRWGTDETWRLPQCVAYERPLSRVAAAVAAARARGVVSADLKDVVALLRAFGSPHVWPRVWILEARALTDEALAAEWSSWVSQAPHLGQLRCGIARLEAEAGRSVVVAVVVDALADLAPLPLVARVGQWLRLDAQLLTGARAGQLLLLGPDESPRRVPSTLDARAFHATFSLDQPGFWRLQLLLDVGFGPQPALEAWLFVDHEPDLELALRSVTERVSEPPVGASTDQLRGALWSMIDAGRRSQGLGSLRRDARLDDVAQAHVTAMLASGRTAHDVGDGMPIDRLTRAGVDARAVGENVARAPTLVRAHRLLWDSPSHRGNLVDPTFDAVGIGVARSEAGDLLVCELFADFGGTLRALPASSAQASRSSSGIWAPVPDMPYTSRAEGSVE
jgi:Cysteine-rich secretory protein family